MRRERIVGCDFIRAIAALGIIIFHFYCHSQNTFKPLLYHANGDFGLVFVTIFFILSGAMCYYNYGLQELNIRSFFINVGNLFFHYFMLRMHIFIYKRCLRRVSCSGMGTPYYYYRLYWEWMVIFIIGFEIIILYWASGF